MTTINTDPVEAPCRIYTLDGGCFVVSDVGAWAYQEWGIFATGRWRSGFRDDSEHDVLIPYSQVKHLEFDFTALERFHAAQLLTSLEAEDNYETDSDAQDAIDAADDLDADV